MKVLLDRLSTSWFIKKRMEKEERRHMLRDEYAQTFTSVDLSPHG